MNGRAVARFALATHRVRTWWLPVLRFLAGAGAGVGVACLIAFVLAIRVHLRADCVPAWLTKSGVARPWRACLPGTAWPD